MKMFKIFLFRTCYNYLLITLGFLETVLLYSLFCLNPPFAAVNVIQPEIFYYFFLILFFCQNAYLHGPGSYCYRVITLLSYVYTDMRLCNACDKKS